MKSFCDSTSFYLFVHYYYFAKKHRAFYQDYEKYMGGIGQKMLQYEANLFFHSRKKPIKNFPLRFCKAHERDAQGPRIGTTY